MTTSIPGHSAPGASFEVPLEMLSACHHRIERQCRTLRRLVPHLAMQGADADARSAAGAVMRYFDTAARDHHADEEKDLFPALLCSASPAEAATVHALTVALTAEHAELDARWKRLRPTLERVANGDATALQAGEVEAFAGLYERHLEREDRELLPLATRRLGEHDLARIGRAMRERRGIDAVD